MSEPGMNRGGMIGFRLSAMMYLEFFIWGAWYVTMWPYLTSQGLDDGFKSWAYTLGPIAAIFSPFFLGMVADRFFATERVLGSMQLLGGAFLIAAPFAMGVDKNLFLAAILLHMLCFMPTLGLTNTLAFHNMTNQEKQFPLIRVWGTVGWIAANWVISKFRLDTGAEMFYVAGGAAILLGVYSFSLPHTPPPSKGQEFKVSDALGLDAIALMKERSFAVFIICSFLICIPLAAYYALGGQYVKEIGFHEIASTMSYGQMSEILFMIVMPLFFARLGVKWMLLVGMGAWLVRYGFFAGAADTQIRWMVLAGIVLHGICYDFFFVTGQIYVDKKADPKIRGAAQGFLVLVTQGLGLGIGAKVTGWLVGKFKHEDYDQLAAAAGAFRDQALDLAKEGGSAEQVDILMRQASDLYMQATDWTMVWMIPAIFAGVVMVIFFLFFNDKSVGKGQPSDLETVTAAQEVDGLP
jgi:nucleoside transporter